MTSVISYIDGFNLYHAIHDLNRPHLKWVDLWSLSASLCRPGERLEAVHYFSAYPTWLPAQYARHRAYVAALEAHRVTTHMAHFKIKDQRCNSCGATWKSREEKETDVRLAVQIVADAYENNFERAIIISADSDLKPPLDYVQREFPRKQMFVAAPPKRFAHARDLNPKMQVTQGRLGKHLLPAKVAHPGGRNVTRPTDYDPPKI